MKTQCNQLGIILKQLTLKYDKMQEHFDGRSDAWWDCEEKMDNIQGAIDNIKEAISFLELTF